MLDDLLGVVACGKLPYAFVRALGPSIRTEYLKKMEDPKYRFYRMEIDNMGFTVSLPWPV